jgi:immunoglobulin heavy chain variable region
MLNLEPGTLADWVGNVISFIGILVASFFTVRYYRKDNRKT